MRNIFGLSVAFVFGLMNKAFANPACAVCTIAVGASLGIARKMGLEDNIVGLWAGAFLALMGYWMIKWFDKKGWKFFGRDFVLIALSVGMIGFMYISDLVYSPIPILYVLYLDAFLFSTILGAVILIYTSAWYQWMKRKNGKAHFPFEKVVIPVVALVLASVYLQYYPIY